MTRVWLAATTTPKLCSHERLAVSAVATRMVSTEKRRKIVELAKDGHDNTTIAREVGLNSRQAVEYHLKQWFAETRPDPEATEELRAMQWARLEDLVAALRPRVVGPVMGMFGPIKDEDGEFVIAPNAQIIDRLMKVYDRQARLMGLDLERNQISINVTRESLAASLGWDGAVIEETAEEVQDADA